MKNVNISWYKNNGPETIYKSPSVRFALLRKTGHKSFDQLPYWRACREAFISDIEAHAKDEKITGTTRLYLAVYKSYTPGHNPKEWKRYIKKVLNTFEKRMGWGLTSIHDICSSCVKLKDKKDVLFVISGSCKWAQCPQLLSLYLLLIRCSNSRSFRGSFLKDFEQIDAGKCGVGMSNRYAVIDSGYIKHLLPFLPQIFDNVDKLFFHQSPYKAFTSQSSLSGITSYVKSDFYGGDKVTKARFKKYIKQPV